MNNVKEFCIYLYVLQPFYFYLHIFIFIYKSQTVYHFKPFFLVCSFFDLFDVFINSLTSSTVTLNF